MTIDIPYAFIRERASVGWTDVQYGLDHQLIKPRAAIEKAFDEIAQTDRPHPDVVTLAGSNEVDPLTELLSRLASAELAPPDGYVKEKWLYLVLSWLYDNSATLNDPLAVVEAIYSDFGYPREIAHFVRSMPMVGDDLGTRERNEARLLDYWREYLESASARFGRRNPGGRHGS